MKIEVDKNQFTENVQQDSTPTPIIKSIIDQSPTQFIPEIYTKVDSFPSKGLSYPQNAEIRYRSYSFGEVKKISQSKGMNLKNVLDVVLTGVQCNFDKYLLTIPDVMYIAFLRTLSSVKGPKVRIDYFCNGCNKRVIKDVDMTRIDFEEISAPALPLCVTLNGKYMEFYPPTIRDYVKLTNIKKDEDELALLAMSCRNISFEEAYKTINELTDTDDYEVVADIDKLLDHKMKPIKFTCGNKLEYEDVCNYETEIELDGGQAILLPFRKHKGSPRDRIQFGKIPAHQPN